MGRVQGSLAAIGLLLAGALVGTNLHGIAGAELGSGSRPSTVTISPCRITDTRASSNVGRRAEPLRAGDVTRVTGRGRTGECNLRNDVVGLVLNVTAVGATQQTNLRVFPSDAALPNASSLNPGPGQPPVPNAVTTSLSSAGQFSVYNANGSVHVVIDVVAVLVNHNHDDRYYTKAQVDERQVVHRMISFSDLVLDEVNRWELQCRDDEVATDPSFSTSRRVIGGDEVVGDWLMTQSFHGGWGDFDPSKWAFEVADFGGLGPVVEVRVHCVSGVVFVDERRADSVNPERTRAVVHGSAQTEYAD